MVFLAIFIALILLIIITIFFSKLSFKVAISFDSDGFKIEIKVMLYRFLKIFSWNSKEGGLDFLLKKKKQVPEDKKKKKGKISSILKLIFSKDTYDHLKKDLVIAILTVKGRISTKNAASTAMLYGNIWSVIGMLMPFIPQKNLVLDFYPDFQKETPDFLISCILRLRIIHIIKLIVNHYLDKIGKGEKETYGTASN